MPYTNNRRIPLCGCLILNNMVNLRLIYEQLEAGKRQLLDTSLLGSRLALILLDNVAELLMYRALSIQFGFDDSFRPRWEPALSEWWKRRMYTPEERKAAEREFEPKTHILHLRLKKISSDDCIVLNTCHRLRNEAFHSGTLRERILQQVSALLFTTVVGLTLKLPIQGYRLPNPPLSNEDASFLERFGFKSAHSLISDQAKQFAEHLLADVLFDNSVFTSTLSDDLSERIDHVIGALEYIGETEDRSQIDRNLQYTQFWRQLGAKLVEDGVRQPELEGEYQKWQANGHARFSLRKLDGWQKQAKAIGNRPTPARALAHYSGIDKRLGPLEDYIEEAVSQYEKQIDAQIEHYKLTKR
jgi:hypothetical protein